MTTTGTSRPRTSTSFAAESLPDRLTIREALYDRAGPATSCADPGSIDAHLPHVGATPCDHQVTPDARLPRVVASPCADQGSFDTHTMAVGAILCDHQSPADAHDTRVVAQLNAGQSQPEAQNLRTGVELLFCAAFLDDIEKLRIATGNRLVALEREGLNIDVYGQQLYALQQLEHQATRALQRAVRIHPLGPWIKRTVGIGEKQGARLIAAIGDIAYNHAHDRLRRGPAELWAYCGFVPGQRRRKGEKANWSAQAKMRAFLVAESCMKHRASPYRADYDRARANWAERDTSDGHKHAHALRVVAKAILRDLFIEARKVGA